MIFGWSNYSNAWTNVTPELKEALAYWTPDQFHTFRSMITKAWWKSFFKKQWPLMAAMVVGAIGFCFSNSQSVFMLIFVPGLSLSISLFSFLSALLRDRKYLLGVYRQATNAKRQRSAHT